MAGISGKGREGLATVTGRGRRIVTVDEAARDLSIAKRDAAKALARWTEQGWLRRVRRGIYIPVPVDADDPRTWSEDPLVVADAVWGPCFFTGWTAANHWALSEQVFRTTALKTTTRVRRNEQRLLSHRYLVIHIDESELWGLEPLWLSERKLSMADPARTVIDMLDDPRLGGGIRHVSDIVATYLEGHEIKPLIEYGDRMGNRTVFKRLGYIIERLKIDNDELVEASRERISAGISTLDPSGPSDGDRVGRWGLRENVRLGPRDAT